MSSMQEVEFNKLSSKNKTLQLEKYLFHQFSISKLNQDKELEQQYDVLLSLKSVLVSRFGKFIIIDKTNRKFINCCDDIETALKTIYSFNEEIDSFIYQMPKTI